MVGEGRQRLGSGELTSQDRGDGLRREVVDGRCARIPRCSFGRSSEARITCASIEPSASHSELSGNSSRTTRTTGTGVFGPECPRLFCRRWRAESSPRKLTQRDDGSATEIERNARKAVTADTRPPRAPRSTNGRRSAKLRSGWMSRSTWSPARNAKAQIARTWSAPRSPEWKPQRAASTPDDEKRYARTRRAA